MEINIKLLEKRLNKMTPNLDADDKEFVESILATFKNDSSADAKNLVSMCEALMSVNRAESDDAASRISKENNPDNASGRINQNKGADSGTGRTSTHTGFKDGDGDDDNDDPATFGTGTKPENMPDAKASFNVAPALKNATSDPFRTQESNILERTYTSDERKTMAEKHQALPDGSFPIKDKEDLKNAIALAHNGSHPAMAKAHIKQRAKELKCDDMIPSDWSDDGSAPSKLHQNAAGSEYMYEAAGDLHQWIDQNTCSILRESSASKTGKEWEVLLIQEGLSKNNNYYSAEVLREAAPLFEGTSAFVNHSTPVERSQRPERSILDKAGRFRNVHLGEATVNGKTVQGLIGTFKVIDPKIREILLESYEAGEPDFLGFSIDAEGKVTRRREGNSYINDINSISKVNSTDIVTDPAAGGRVMRLVATDRPNEEIETEENNLFDNINIKETVAAAVAAALAEKNAEIQESHKALNEVMTIRNEMKIDKFLNEASISAVSKKEIKTTLMEAANRRSLEDEDILSQITSKAVFEAQVQQQYANPAAIAQGGRASIHMGMTSHDRFDAAILGMFENQNQKCGDYEVPRFRSLKEAYSRWTGTDPFDISPYEMQDAFMTKYDSVKDHKKIRESLSLASWGSIYADNLYIQLIKAYRNSAYNVWAQFVSDIEDVPDFQTRHWTRVGGYSDLSTVAEQGTYPQLVTPTNEAVSYSVSKRGGLDDVTFEAIVDDRFNAIRRIPLDMGRSASRTLWKFVMNMMTTGNPTMSYDSTALYIAGHNNVDTANALSVKNVGVGYQKMRAQTAYNEANEILGVRNKPKFLIVPGGLEQVANRIINPSDAYGYGLNTTGNTDTDTSYDPQEFKGRLTPYVYDVLTSATQWFMVADPQEVPTMVMGFLNGNREPEMFVQDQPNVGSVMTADKITYKVRHIYGGVIEDHRSFYRGYAT